MGSNGPSSTDQTLRHRLTVREGVSHHPPRRVPKRIRFSLVLVLVLLVGSSCQDGETRRPSSPLSGVTPSASLACNSAVVDMSAAPGVDPWDVGGNPDLRIVGGVAALRTASAHRSAHSASHSPGAEPTEDPAFLIAPKTPLFVRRGAAFELRVGESFRDRAALRFGNLSRPTSAILVGPCDSEREWLLFTGRILLTEPECLTLELVLQDGLIEPIQMGIGVACAADRP